MSIMLSKEELQIIKSLLQTELLDREVGLDDYYTAVENILSRLTHEE